MKRSKIDLTHVKRCTYKAIADELGYSYDYVRKVASGRMRNAYIEERLLRAVRERLAQEKRIERLRSYIRRGM